VFHKKWPLFCEVIFEHSQSPYDERHLFCVRRETEIEHVNEEKKAKMSQDTPSPEHHLAIHVFLF